MMRWSGAADGVTSLALPLPARASLLPRRGPGGCRRSGAGRGSYFLTVTVRELTVTIPVKTLITKSRTVVSVRMS